VTPLDSGKVTQLVCLGEVAAQKRVVDSGDIRDAGLEAQLVLGRERGRELARLMAGRPDPGGLLVGRPGLGGGEGAGARGHRGSPIWS
jgi:hypothetical protein